MDEMGDILEERPHGRHIAVFSSDGYADSIAVCLNVCLSVCVCLVTRVAQITIARHRDL